MLQGTQENLEERLEELLKTGEGNLFPPYLDLKAVNALSRVSMKWNQIMNKPQIWRALIDKDLSILKSMNPKRYTEDPKTYYKNTYIINKDDNSEFWYGWRSNRYISNDRH